MTSAKGKAEKKLRKDYDRRAIVAELRGCILDLRDRFKVDDHPIWKRVDDTLDRAKTF